MEVKILSARFDIENAHRIEVAKQHGVYRTLDSLFAMEPADVIETVKASGLRGRGGAGFPTGVKWGFSAERYRQAGVPGGQCRRIGAGHL